MKWSGKKIGGFILAAILVCGGGTYAYMKWGVTKKAAATTETISEVKKGNLTVAVSATSQLEAQDLQKITAPSAGTLKALYVSRNQEVKKDDVLLEISNPTLQSNLQKAKNTLAQYESDLADLQQQLANLTATAPIAGKITLASNVDVGLKVSKTTRLATISDYSQLIVTLPFLLEDAVQMKKGDAVELTIDSFKLTKTGTIESIGKEPRGDSKGNKVIDVEVLVENDGSMDSGIKAKGAVNVGGRDVESQDSGTFKFNKTVNVMANIDDAEIVQMFAKDNTFVKAGDSIASMVNEDIDQDLKSKQAQVDEQRLTVQDYQDQVDDLIVKAPIDGVFSTDFADTKTNVLSTLSIGSRITSSLVFGGVASTTTMNMIIAVDELDLPKIKTGMTATITIDSVTGKTFEGTVNQVSTVGTTTNGVTNYNVIIGVKDTSTLKYGMTGTANILIEDKKDVLLIPIEALQTQNRKRYVTLKKADGTNEQVEIQIGSQNKTSVEVTSGLNEGDKIVIPKTTAKQTTTQQDMDRLRQQFQQQGGVSGGTQGGGTNRNSSGGGGGAR
ncbi:efflux RND transporter periplasmic adaptor subunit [Paenibacillus sp. y28]|uniref:efflux RND transporter periplasmic adaptor subunit n=1 Tax=Paenibacillus sp. y28 TaxID=3129110 RepID=UPI003015D29A